MNPKMKKFCTCFVLLFLSVFCSCIARGGNENIATGKAPLHSREAKRVLTTLRKAAQRKRPLMGHQDALMYGQNWWINGRDSLYERSDVYEVYGQYPYVLGLDLGRIERGGERNIDQCLFRQMKGAAIAHHKRGGIVTISWHMDNPVTDSTAWDRTAGNVVKAILNDSRVHEKYLRWLDRGADFLNQLVDKKGKKIPVLFRPLHECNIESFWWSPKSCSDEDYVSLWRLTFNYLVKEKKMTQLLWVYSPYDIKSEEELTRRYPGDEYVDVIGYELYQRASKNNQDGSGSFVRSVKKGIDETVAFAKPRKKVVAFTETGFCKVTLENWWTEVMGEAIRNKNIAYIHLWRNGNRTYYYAPGPVSENNDDFVRLCKSRKIRLLKK